MQYYDLERAKIATLNCTLRKPVLETNYNITRRRANIYRIYLFEMVQCIDAIFAHLRNKSDASDENPMIFFSDQTTSSW